MDLPKLRVPILLVFVALGVAAGAGASAAVTSSKAASTEKRVEKLEEKTEEDRLDVRELKVMVKQVSEDVRHIKRKLDRE